MYNIAIIKKDSIDSVEKLNSINLSDDVIISKPSDRDTISFNINGRIEIHPEKEINFTFAKQISGFVPCLRQQIIRYPLKLYIPYGYEPIFTSPLGCNWMTSINTNYETYSGYILDKDFNLVDKTINFYSEQPNYIIYRKFIFTLQINTEIMKNELPTMTITPNDVLCELHIHKNLCNHFASGKLFYIQNDEVYYKLTDTI